MSAPSRRTLLAGAAILTATAAAAQDQGLEHQGLEPVEGSKGAKILGPRNPPREQQSPDLLQPPSTDHGALPNLRFAFSDAHVKMREGGWSREVTARELPVATTIAGVNMRLDRYGVRELHWHKEAEWAFVLAGRARITAVDNNGQNFVADVEPGDLWFFPPGIPHSIQGLPPDGTEFVLAFPNGQFSEDSTFAITDLFAHLPRASLARNFAVDRQAFDHLPKEEKFIFPGPPAPALTQDLVQGPNGQVPLDMRFRLTEQTPDRSPGGEVRIADTRNFHISSEIAAALVDVNPGHMREVHWHPNADEWQYYVSGQARMTVFAAQANARTFDFQAGDVGYVPKSMAHSIENTGNAPLRFLELFNAPNYMDVSLSQWMALTPPELVQAHLEIDRGLIDSLSRKKQAVV